MQPWGSPQQGGWGAPAPAPPPLPPPRRHRGAGRFAAAVLLLVAVAGGGIVGVLALVGGGSVSDGAGEVVDRVDDVVDPLPRHPTEEFAAICGGVGDDRFDRYDPSTPPTTIAGRSGSPARGTALAFPWRPGPITADSLEGGLDEVAVGSGWRPPDSADIQLVICLTQGVNVPNGECRAAVGGGPLHKAAFHMSVREAATGREVYVSDFEEFNQCYVPYIQDPENDWMAFHDANVVEPIRSLVTGP